MAPCPVVSLLGENPMLLFHGPHMPIVAKAMELLHRLIELFRIGKMILAVIINETMIKEAMTFHGLTRPMTQVNSLLARSDMPC